MRDSEDRVALHYAAETMELDMFKKIFEQDPTLLDCEDKNGHTPLLMAVMGGRIDLIEFLISKGADINHCDRDGHSAVHWAVVCGQVCFKSIAALWRIFFFSFSMLSNHVKKKNCVHVSFIFLHRNISRDWYLGKSMKALRKMFCL
ncbi:unnamed protein product [Cylicostephanus goldi]|uniref:Uncharacterized protein n=1 Tax=Cylicostephanus goldi TaxID=71465 RepID=A0A3P7LRW3_CYLGO|nr:unnamed protein product [Cylicostephanus goldi]